MMRNNKTHKYFLIALSIFICSCEDLLNPKPVDTLTDEIVLNEAKDVQNVRIGLYSSFRTIPPATVIAGDFTADMLIHNGTFSQYRELGTKQISSGNGSVSTLWGAIYNTVYIANFIIERLPDVPGVSEETENSTLAEAHFLRGYSYFIGLFTFGGIPKVLTTSIETNRNIPRATEQEILDLIVADYDFALNNLPDESENPGYANQYAIKAALARLHLYLGNWELAESYATEVISSEKYTLDADFSSVVENDFPNESIFEVAYSSADDPGTNTNIGLNNLFVGRREIIPSNQAIIALASDESGDRIRSMRFNLGDLEGTDNGWAVAKYGTADEDNNNIIVFRLAEMFLIRAEARAQLGNITGAKDDLNVLRTRAAEEGKEPVLVGEVSKDNMLLLIEEERRYELAFEGHRWYDLVRTGRADAVMASFNSNWKSTYNLWPIPQYEIQNNPALKGNQNPGY
jgi:starch-binding outer membrane protein, SusD/RagB family